MNKSFIQIKKRPFFAFELTKLISKLLSMGIAENNKKEIEKAILQFLANVKENVYRKEDYDYHREDVMNKIKENFGNKGLMVAKAVPEHIISAVIDTWQDDLGNADTYWDVNWSILEDVLYGESWLSDFKPYTHKQISRYIKYLRDWFATHNEGDPVCIEEFFNVDVAGEENG